MAALHPRSSALPGDTPEGQGWASSRVFSHLWAGGGWQGIVRPSRSSQDSISGVLTPPPEPGMCSAVFVTAASSGCPAKALCCSHGNPAPLSVPQPSRGAAGAAVPCPPACPCWACAPIRPYVLLCPCSPGTPPGHLPRALGDSPLPLPPAQEAASTSVPQNPAENPCSCAQEGRARGSGLCQDTWAAPARC